ncbi:4-hydroxy-3-methylbut-2-en-1-yl diphosphate synthase [Candidatus Peregrinibacteria bacterium CG10_big_fil_rev_8_21_14_0_10_36_19]|nr:MAG: 4-hydroxy-3-methylbut-2-en-1-yl diphosphate synthase [Candidatus Peregrinibacteria bacterium CG10_big_fil_rev_8_21_14_0_10_36_19]
MRIKTPEVQIRDLKMGNNNPIVIQSMTNTDTSDPKATAKQCIELAEAGSQLVRITVNTNLAAAQVPKIRELLDRSGYKHLPLVGDFHFNGHELLTEFPEMAKALDKYRINPGNVGKGDKRDKNFEAFIKVAVANNKPVRIGVNWGSLDQDLLTHFMEKNASLVSPREDREVIIDAVVESALKSAELAEELGLPQNQIVLSVKMSVVPDVIEAYEKLAARMSKSKHFYALHLGLTEAGSGMQGLISSSAALSILLNQGIGDTIRISLTPTPEEPRTKEVEACKTLLQALGYKNFQPKVTSCPGCGRTGSHFFQELAQEVNFHITEKMKDWKTKYPGVEDLKIAVMGCVVNGPGESKHSDIAISLPGKMEKPVAPVYIKGEYLKSLQGSNISNEFIEILEDFIKENY